MRIIGGRDYYDSAMGLGHDATTVFVREAGRRLSDRDVMPITSIHVAVSDGKRRRFVGLSGRVEEFSHQKTHLTLARLGVIFCGKLHYGMMVTQEPEFSGKLQISCIWETTKFDELLDKLGLRMTLARQLAGRHAVPNTLAEALFGSQPINDRLLTWLITNKVVHAIRFPQTSYASNADLWEVNSARLQEVEFYRKFDAYQTYQEIEMWITGVLPDTMNSMASISDADRIAKHGFDDWSFRQPKQT